MGLRCPGVHHVAEIARNHIPDNDFRIMQGWYDSELSIAIPPEMVEQRQSLSVVQHKVVP